MRCLLQIQKEIEVSVKILILMGEFSDTYTGYIPVFSSHEYTFAVKTVFICYLIGMYCTDCPAVGSCERRNLKSHLVRTQRLNVFPLKPGVGQYIAIHATLTARDFFLPYFYPSGPFTCIYPKPLPIFPVLVVANTWFLCRPAE